MIRPKLSRFRALVWIVTSTVLISGTATVAFFFHTRWKTERKMSVTYVISEIEQAGSGQGLMPTDYLAEILHLSVDHPQNLYTFDLAWAKQRLTSHPNILRADISVIAPSTLRIDYALRVPVARLYDLTNTGIDANGYTFPLLPFWEADGLPEILLGGGDPQRALPYVDLPVSLIDVSTPDLVFITPEGHILRLDPDNVDDAMANYSRLSLDHPVTVDLRLPHLAYIGDR